MTKTGGGGADEVTTKFPCGRWLEECEACGGKLEVELAPEGSPSQLRKNQKEGLLALIAQEGKEKEGGREREVVM